MKTDKAIAAEAMTWFVNSKEESFAAACEKAISLARQYGALPAPAAPLSFVEQAAIAAMQGMLAHSTRYKPRPGASANWHEAISEEAAELAIALEVALKKGGAA